MELAVVIVAMIAAAVAFLNSYLDRKTRKKAEVARIEAEHARLQVVRALTAGDEQRRRYLKARAPYIAGTNKRVVTFDETGSGEIVQTWTGIRTEQSYQILKIPFQQRVACGGLESLLPPEVESLSDSSLLVSLEQATSPAKLREIEEAGRITHTIIEFQVVISGPFNQSTGPVGFRLKVPFKNIFYMTQEEMTEAYKEDDFKREYSAVVITVPTDQLELTVSFPPSHHNMRPEPSPVVFIGVSETVILEQSEQLASPKYFSFVDGVATLVVPQPLSGLAYAISWIPPRS